MSHTLCPPRLPRLQRSELPVPGSNPGFIDKAADSAADVVCCDWGAQGIVDAFGRLDVDLPAVVRLAGTHVEEGRDAGITVAPDPPSMGATVAEVLRARSPLGVSA